MDLSSPAEQSKGVSVRLSSTRSVLSPAARNSTPLGSSGNNNNSIRRPRDTIPYAPTTTRRLNWLQFSKPLSGAMVGVSEEDESSDKQRNRQRQSFSNSSSGNVTPEISARTGLGRGDSKRLSFSSLLSLGATIYGSRDLQPVGSTSTASSIRSVPTAERTPPASSISTSLKSEPVGPLINNVEDQDVDSQASSSLPNPSSMAPPISKQSRTTTSSNADQGEWVKLGSTAPPRRSRSRTKRRPSASTATSSVSPNQSDRSNSKSTTYSLGKVGICALDTKARSKPSRNILTRLQNNGEFEIIVFGDKVILDEEVENWPLCDYLISFFSDGFPLDKAIKYANLRQPFCVNDLPMQKVLWDRRLCLRILDSIGVPTPTRLEVNRDGGPRLDSMELAEHVKYYSGVRLQGPEDGTGGGYPPPKNVELVDDGDTLVVDGSVLRKPFVEKPVSGEDHNVHIYFAKSHNGGGGRRLFRKIGNKSSEWDEKLVVPRCLTQEGSSYLYEQFIGVDNAEDVKAYTVGTDFCHAETRRSPVVDGLVQRNTHGKEVRYITSLTKEEASMASRIAQGFGQRICGFDLLRANNKSYVIDVNGWSFVKDNNEYYDNCAKLLKRMFLAERERQEQHQGVKGVADEQEAARVPPRPSVSHQHRQALKGLFKSPSISKLHGHGQKERTPGHTSPEVSAITTPVGLAASLDNRQNFTGIGEPLLNQPGNAAPTSTSSVPELPRSEVLSPEMAPLPAAKHSWKLKGMVAVIRHADRTPKQKFKFTFHTQPFVELLKGHREEVLLKGEAALGSVLDAVQKAKGEGLEDPAKLNLLETSLKGKSDWTGTKVQIKPMFRKRKVEEIQQPTAEEIAKVEDGKPSTAEALQIVKARTNSLTDLTMSRFTAGEEDLVLDKMQLVIKWGGEPTHSARYQSQDLGENMRKDLLLMNKEALDDVRVFSSSERRVITSAQIWASAFLDLKEIPDDLIAIRKDLLDDSNAAKDVMDKVKKKLKTLLRQGHEAPPQFAWPANTPEPYLVVRRVAELMRFHRRVMRNNMNKLKPQKTETGELKAAVDVSTIQARWCCGEDAELFKERWEKLFTEFSDSEKVDPSKVSELYDTMKFDALHNRQFLEWVFTPGSEMLKEMLKEKQHGEYRPVPTVDETENRVPIERVEKPSESETASPYEKEKNFGTTLADRLGFKKKANLPTIPGAFNTLPDQQEPYFKLYSGSGQTRAKQDERLENLRELYRLAKVLNDFICPQEYGIEDSEKLEIGLLTSLPLLKEIVQDLEEVQASEDAKSFVYFTKESHIYTLLNAILEGGVQTKIARNAIPELDYLSQICFELYESEDKDTDQFAYSIRITISPGCHTSDPLDLLLDSKHSITFAPRRTLTPHSDWKTVIETLRAKFHTVKLPKSFIAINLSERHARDWEKGDVGKTDVLKEGQRVDESKQDIEQDIEEAPAEELVEAITVQSGTE